MYSNFELKTYTLIDNFLLKLVAKNECFPSEIDTDVNSPELQHAYKIMIDEKLIHFKRGFQDFNSAVTISSNGLNILKSGSYLHHLNNLKEQLQHSEHIKTLEFEKTQVDLQISKNILKEYPITKWTARIGLIIALGLAVLELLKFLKGR